MFSSKKLLCFFLMVSLTVFSSFFCVSCNRRQEKTCNELTASKIGRLNRTDFIPLKAKNIHYFYSENMLGESLEWSCVMEEIDFLEFAKHNRWSILYNFFPKEGFSLTKISYTMPSEAYLYATRNGVSIDFSKEDCIHLNNPHQGVQVIYDKKRKVMFGRYVSR